MRESTSSTLEWGDDSPRQQTIRDAEVWLRLKCHESNQADIHEAAVRIANIVLAMRVWSMCEGKPT